MRDPGVVEGNGWGMRVTEFRKHMQVNFRKDTYFK